MFEFLSNDPYCGHRKQIFSGFYAIRARYLSSSFTPAAKFDSNTEKFRVIHARDNRETYVDKIYGFASHFMDLRGPFIE